MKPDEKLRVRPASASNPEKRMAIPKTPLERIYKALELGRRFRALQKRAAKAR